jgi:hypothetical protein
MATWTEVADHWMVKMMAIFKEPTDGDRAVAMTLYHEHLTRYPVDVLDQAWAVLKVKKTPWWPTLGEVDTVCARFMPRPAEPPAGRRGRWWRGEEVEAEEASETTEVLAARLTKIDQQLEKPVSDTPLGPTVRRILTEMRAEVQSRFDAMVGV